MPASSVHPSRAPALLIRLQLEGAPELLIDALNEGEEDRLTDWIVHQDDLWELVDLAAELRDLRTVA